MSKEKIAFQGEMGAYSHIACEQLFPGSSINACPTFEETFRTANQDENCKIVDGDSIIAMLAKRWKKKKF